MPELKRTINRRTRLQICETITVRVIATRGGRVRVAVLAPDGVTIVEQRLDRELPIMKQPVDRELTTAFNQEKST
ncbi:MAG: hypothetical protein ACOY3P_14345 [Planctomycetota bacterium]